MQGCGSQHKVLLRNIVHMRLTDLIFMVLNMVSPVFPQEEKTTKTSYTYLLL